MEVGADAELQRFDPRPAPFQGKLSDLARVRRALSQGAFASIRFTLGERLQVTPGVRTDLYVEEGTSRFLVQPRLATRVVVGPRLTLKLDAGQFSQMASLPVNVAGFESFGLASIGLQRSDALSAGIRTRAPGDIEVDVTGYGQRMRVTDIRNLNLIDMMPQGDDYLALREGLGTGVEVMVRRPSHHRVHGWLAYTLSWSYRVVDGLRVRSDWDQRHILNLVGGWRVGRGYSVGARLHFHTGRMAPLFDNMGSYVQLPNNYRLDLRAERRFYFDRLVMDLYIDIANATFQKEIVQYVYVGNGESVPQHIFIVLPTIGVHVEL
jgi:hypothetical protein